MKKTRKHITPVPFWDPSDILLEHGIQTRISEATGVKRPTVCSVLNGKLRASTATAVALEEFFIGAGLPLNRWDLLLYVADGQPLVEYVNMKIHNSKWARKLTKEMLNGGEK